MPSTGLETALGSPAGYPVLEEDRFARANRERLSGPGLRTFLAIADQWGLTKKERILVLGSVGEESYDKWTSAAHHHLDLVLEARVLTRISAVLGLHSGLSTLGLHASKWLRDAHLAQPFRGRAPIELVVSKSVDDLLQVRRCVDAASAGHPMCIPGNDGIVE